MIEKHHIMTRSLLIILLTAFSIQLIAQTTLLECGQNSGRNFDGWYVSPNTSIDAIEFDENGTYFFSEFGGNYDLSMTKKISELKEIQSFSLVFNFEVLHHATIAHVVYYTSTDGKRWTPIQSSRNNVAVAVDNQDLNIQYIRAVATVSFEKNGKISCNYAKVVDLREEQLSDIYIEEEPLNDIPAFYIFSYAHTLTVETTAENPHEVLITAMSGQIVYRETFEGSTRIDLPFDLSGIFIVNIIHNSSFEATKKIALQ